MSDPVNHPAHYTAGRKYEPLDVIEDWGLGYHLGSVLKYISRAGRKDDLLNDLGAAEIQDLLKARFYLDRRISKLERERKNGPADAK